MKYAFATAALMASALFALAIAAGPEPTGYWDGTLVESGQILSASLVLENAGDGKLSGRFYSDSQAVYGYPFDKVSIAGDKVHISLGGGDIVFVGTISADTFGGTFSGQEGRGQFEFRRTQPPMLPYDLKDVTFANGAITLAGTIFQPKSEGAHPAVVLLQGSGCEIRWGTSAFIADQLARRGIAALVYDKRGCGSSSGSWLKADFPALADDAIAGLELLKQQPGIDPAKIGIWGHSQGGFIAPLLASRSKQVAFIVAADSPASHTYEQDLFRVGNEIRVQKWRALDRRQAMSVYRMFIDVLRSKKGYAGLARVMQANKGQAWLTWLGIPPKNNILWSYYPLIGNFDSRTYWRNVQVPVFLPYGQDDQLVPVNPSIATIESLLSQNGNTSFESVIYPGAPHTLKIRPLSTQKFFWWHRVAGYPEIPIDWIARIMR